MEVKRKKLEDCSVNEITECIEEKLKVDSYNTITIHPIKNNWSREEVETLCRNAMFTGELLGREPLKATPFGKGFDEISDNWIKQNL